MPRGLQGQPCATVSPQPGIRCLATWPVYLGWPLASCTAPCPVLTPAPPASLFSVQIKIEGLGGEAIKLEDVTEQFQGKKDEL